MRNPQEEQQEDRSGSVDSAPGKRRIGQKSEFGYEASSVVRAEEKYVVSPGLAIK